MNNSNMKKGFVLEDGPATPALQQDFQEEALKEAPKKGFVLSDEEVSAAIRDVVLSDDAVGTTIDITEAEELPPPPNRFWTSPVLWIIALVVALGGLQAYYFIVSAYQQNLAVGIVLNIIIGILLVMLLWTVARELKSVLKLKKAQVRQIQIQTTMVKGTASDALALCGQLADDSNMRNSVYYQNFARKVKPHFSPGDVFALYESELLKHLDERAKRLIIKRSRENGLVVALSPLSWLDMVFTLARSLRLIREISEIYGLKCGLWGRMQLYRRVARNIIFIGMTDLATDAVVDVAGAGLAGRVSAALGQGIAAGIYSTRLGYMTVKAVRPIEINRDNFSLGKLRKALLTEGKFLDLLKEQEHKH